MNFSFKSLLAALILLCSTVATAHGFEVGGIFYNITSITEKTVEVTYKGDSYYAYHNEYTSDVTVPSTVAYNGNTYSVTSIGYEAFRDCYRLTSIEIPGSVTSIGYCAFNNCGALTSVTIGDGVTSIGGYAFCSCSGLTSIVVDGNNRHYDSREGCNAIIETATNTLIQGCQNTIIPG
ncbi:MAG: leucine-rich repeat domain-containing protein, partial [Bacteroidaceae bacterium]|nr:leucine-rich repeat domain-containing protein [Bacteroidaceae bacterium]